MSVDQKYELLNKRYNELFQRTANLMRAKAKNDSSKHDLERTVKFMRADLNTKALMHCQGIGGVTTVGVATNFGATLPSVTTPEAQ